jgi:small subunit ribosomal protein S2
MAELSMRELLEAGVHFGHPTRKWHPNMRRYIYGARSGIHIIDLHKTVEMFDRAQRAVKEVVNNGGHVLFVGTKKQARDAIKEAAIRSRQYHITYRWLGGTLTNFRTIQSRVKRLKELERMIQEGELDRIPKKEASRLRKEHEKLERNLGGIKDMPGLPAALFIVDLKEEHTAVAEAADSVSRQSLSWTPTATLTKWTTPSLATTMPSARSASSRGASQTLLSRRNNLNGKARWSCPKKKSL